MNIINDNNIKDLVKFYCTDRTKLPPSLQQIPINNWDVSNVTNMDNLFNPKTYSPTSTRNSFNEPLNDWNVSNVTTMNNMFRNCYFFDKPLNKWDVSNVTNMSYMFAGCFSFNQNLNDWDVSKVTTMSFMFIGCSSFNTPLNNWNVSNVTDISSMFNMCSEFNQALNNWNVSNVTNMSLMFSDCIRFNKPLNNWNISHETNIDGMFTNCPISEANKPLIQIPPEIVPPQNRPRDIYQELIAKPLESSSITIQPNDTGYDVIMLEDINIIEYLNQNSDNIVFFSNTKYYPSTKTQLFQLISELPNIKFECIRVGSMAPSNINRTIPYLNMKSVGLIVDSLAPLNEIKTILTTPEIQACELVQNKTIATTVSLNALENTNDIERNVSASHCQEGQGGNAVNLKIIHINISPRNNEKKRHRDFPDITGGKSYSSKNKKRQTKRKYTKRRKTKRRKTKRRKN